MGEALLEQRYAKEMIAMAVRRVNRSQVLAARHDPVRQGLRGFGGKEGVDQHGIPLAVDQRGRIGYPGQGLVARRKLPVEARPLGDEHRPPQGSVFMVRPRHDNSSWSFCITIWIVAPN